MQNDASHPLYRYGKFSLHEIFDRVHTLRATLGIERPDIIVDNSWGFMEYVLVKGLAVEGRHLLIWDNDKLQSSSSTQHEACFFAIKLQSEFVPFVHLGANLRRL